LSGDIGGDDITDGNVVTTTDHISGYNSYHVVIVDGTVIPITGTTILDGFTITAGQANVWYPHQSGGGLRCKGSGSEAECSPQLSNLIFSGNYAEFAGGGMHNHGDEGISSPILQDVIFNGNYADSRGGGMYNNGSYQGTSSPVLVNVSFISNAAGGFGGAMHNDGFKGTSSPTLMDVTFSDNTADRHGGAMLNDGGYDGISYPRLTNVTFSRNSAENGGAMYNNISNPTLINVIFAGNSVIKNGGAIYNNGFIESSTPRFINVTFSGNNADLDGGAIYNDGYRGECSPQFTNVTFSGNSAGEHGGAIYNMGEDGTLIANFANVILWGNTAVISGSQMFNLESSVLFTTSLVQGGVTGNGIYNNVASTVTDLGGNIDDDPDFFRNPDPGPDGYWDGVEDDYGDLHLLAGSPAIDVGTDSAITITVDLDGNPRKADGDGDGTPTVDIGAYELPPPQILTISLEGDGSGTVTGEGIHCHEGPGADCSETFLFGTTVSLSASAESGSVFDGWSGPCGGIGGCDVKMDAAKTVTGTFNQNIELVFLPLLSNNFGKDNMIYISAGEYIIGSGTTGEDCYPNDSPSHTVYLDAFYIDKYEITNYLYSQCVDEGTCTPPDEVRSHKRPSYFDNPVYMDYPVIYVDWHQADAYCTWAEKRLPTEAEWEKAARGDNEIRFPWGDGDPNCNRLNGSVWNGSYYQKCVGDTSQVGGYPQGASPYGVLDMAGNVTEWVNDWYSSSYYCESPYENPPGPATGQYKVIRGGNWHGDIDPPWHTYLVFARSRTFPHAANTDRIGFRCAADAP
jgi:predicted outer membrane repeat protein